jgi:hypothetical protein
VHADATNRRVPRPLPPGMAVLAIQKYMVSHSPRAKWPEEAPTRPVHNGAVSVSGVRTATPPPLPLEKVRAAASSCLEVSEGELLEEQPGAGGGAPSGTRLSTAPPPPNDFDRGSSSTRPPSPSLPEVVVDPRLERRPRKWIGWVAVTIAVGASASILAAAAVARTRAHAAAAVEASEAHAAPSAPSVSASTASTDRPGPQAAGTATAPQPPSAMPAKPLPRSTHKGSTRKPGH